MECKTSTLGNKHILTIINHPTGWPETFPILDNSADTIVSTFINDYLPVHMCLRYILSDNNMEFKNQLMDQVLQQTQHWLHLLCTIPPPEQWEIGSLSQVPKTHTLQKGSTQLGPIHKSSTCQLCHLAPTSGTNETFPRRPRLWKTQLRKSSPCTSHCKEDTWWKSFLGIHTKPQTANCLLYS